jgi:hypothetical protein
MGRPTHTCRRSLARRSRAHLPCGAQVTAAGLILITAIIKMFKARSARKLEVRARLDVGLFGGTLSTSWASPLCTPHQYTAHCPAHVCLHWTVSQAARTQAGAGQNAATYGTTPSALAGLNMAAARNSPAVQVARTADGLQDMAHHTASHPSVVEIPMAKVIRGTARYIVKVSTADGRQWAVAKRFSEFFDLKVEVSPRYFLSLSCGSAPAHRPPRLEPARVGLLLDTAAKGGLHDGRPPALPRQGHVRRLK